MANDDELSSFDQFVQVMYAVPEETLYAVSEELLSNPGSDGNVKVRNYINAQLKDEIIKFYESYLDRDDMMEFKIKLDALDDLKQDPDITIIGNEDRIPGKIDGLNNIRKMALLKFNRALQKNLQEKNTILNDLMSQIAMKRERLINLKARLNTLNYD